jgi:hypothetical protein
MGSWIDVYFAPLGNTYENGEALLIQTLGTEEAVMGPYYPRGEYTDRATFEANGPKE